jgi:hypothetical protein
VNPLTDEPLGCNFLHYKPGNKLRIPIEFMNTDLNVCIRRGSYIVKINRYLECVCSGLNIPKTIQIDAKDLQDDSLIRLKDVILPPGVSPGTHSLTYSPTHSLTYSPTHSLTYSPTHSLTYSHTHSLTYSLTHLLTYSLTHLLTHSPNHLLTHSPNHLLTHSPAKGVPHDYVLGKLTAPK